MSVLLGMIIWIAIAGVIVWLITTAFPMPQPFRNIIIAIVAIACLIWLASALGAFPMPHLQVK